MGGPTQAARAPHAPLTTKSRKQFVPHVALCVPPPLKDHCAVDEES